MVIADLPIETIIERYAKEYKAALLPDGLKYGEPGDCFDYCTLLVLNNPEYTYVEGVASDPKTGNWLVHSWITDGVHAFDPTWRTTKNDTGEYVVMPSKYYGIPFKRMDLFEFIAKTKMKSVLHNRGLAPELFQRMIREHQIIGEVIV